MKKVFNSDYEGPQIVCTNGDVVELREVKKIEIKDVGGFGMDYITFVFHTKKGGKDRRLAGIGDYHDWFEEVKQHVRIIEVEKRNWQRFKEAVVSINRMRSDDRNPPLPPLKESEVPVSKRGGRVVDWGSKEIRKLIGL